MFIELNMMITFFIFRRPIIIGWGRDTGTIFWPIRNSIRICGWRLDRQVDPIKIEFTGSPILRSSAHSVSTVGSSQSISSSQSKEFVALQQHTAQLIKKYDYLSAKYAQLKASHAQQRAESEQLKASHAQQRAESEQLKASQAQQRVKSEQQKTAYSFVKWSWTWQHRVEHVRLILFGRITTSLLLQDLLLLQLHLYINL